MASTEWDVGPFNLTTESISSIVTKKSAGAYALGRKNSTGGFMVDYIGRSDDDLNARLKSWVGKYTHFKAGYFSSANAAFLKECKLYHDFLPHGIDNKIHPDRAKNADWSCPVCEIFD